MSSTKPSDALRELRGLVATYLEGSDDAPRAVELLDALIPSDEAPLVKPSGCATMVGGSLGLLHCDLPGGHAEAHRWISEYGPVGDFTDPAIPVPGDNRSAVERFLAYQQEVRELDRERALFGCTAAAIDEALAGKTPRDVAVYAMGTLSNAQELIQCLKYEGRVVWTLADRHTNTLRQFMNIAKYAIDKAVPR